MSLPNVPHPLESALILRCACAELDRRKPGQSRITTPRNEDDQVEILSGLSPEGLTLGTPIAMLVRNKVRCSKKNAAIVFLQRRILCCFLAVLGGTA